MPYSKTTWVNETPATTPVKYQIVDDNDGEIAASATIAPVTSITPGTPVDATRMNKIENGLESATTLAEAALARASVALYGSGAFYLDPSTPAVFDPFAGATYNPLNMWSAGDPERVTVPQTGLYSIYATATIGGVNVGRLVRVTLLLGATPTVIQTLTFYVASSSVTVYTINVMRYITASGYIRLQLEQTSDDQKYASGVQMCVARVG